MKLNLFMLCELLRNRLELYAVMNTWYYDTTTWTKICYENGPLS